MCKKHIESIEDIRNRVLDLCEQVDCGMISPPINGQTAFEELCRFILGDYWYYMNPISQEQINTEMLYEAEVSLRKKVWQAKKPHGCRNCHCYAIVYPPTRFKIFKKNRNHYIEQWSVHCSNSCFMLYAEGDPRYFAPTSGRTRQEAIDNWEKGKVDKNGTATDRSNSK